jgi:hypothetical protein
MSVRRVLFICSGNLPRSKADWRGVNYQRNCTLGFCLQDLCPHACGIFQSLSKESNR